ncbi:MAG: hypothetical protein JWN94_1033 [Betaproteobacteria bacterium]|nr:hypothetical protein [Betaproteobacteria bacterium]
MEKEKEERKDRVFRIPYSLAISFLAGVVVPLVAAGIPQLVDYWRNRDDFRYERDNPVYFLGKIAYALEVMNKGRVIERNVEVWLPSSKEEELTVELDAFELRPLQPIKVRQEQEFKVVSLGDMRQDEGIRLSILKSWKNLSFGTDGTLMSYPAFTERVISNDRVGKYVAKRDSVWDTSPKNSANSYMLIILAVLTIVLTAMSFGLSAFTRTMKGKTEQDSDNN